MRCAVFGCNADKKSKNCDRTTAFFRFPRNELELRLKWINSCYRSDKFNVNTSRICSRHFKKDDIERNLKHELLNLPESSLRLKLKHGSVPSQNLPGQTSNSTPSTDDEFEERLEERKRLKERQIVLDEVYQRCADNSAITGDDINLILADNNNYNGSSFRKTRDVGVNTDKNTQQENLVAALLSKIISLENEIEVLKKKEASSNKYLHPAQQLKISDVRSLKWNVGDVSKAVANYSASPQVYRIPLKIACPYPAVTTLKNLVTKISISPGILKSIFPILNHSNISDFEKMCSLSFDEMRVKQVYEYDRKNDRVLKPASYVLVAMLRSIFGNWKQPVFYDFDCKMTKHLLFQLINFVEDSGFKIIAMVSDLNRTNRELYLELGIDHITKTWFTNPFSNEKVFVFADVPHLIKLLRNHYIDQGFIVNGKIIDRDILDKLLNMTKHSDLKIFHNKVSIENLNVKGAARQKVKLATKLFSQTVAAAIHRCGILGLLDEYNWVESSEFFKKVNDWFDIMNCKVPESDSRDHMKGLYGLELKMHNQIISDMTNLMNDVRVTGKNTLLPFQKGILMCNISLKQLYEDLKKRFSIQYILTYKLNRDVLKIFCEVIRTKEGLHDHPTPLEFTNRLRSYILGRDKGSHSTCNVEINNTPDSPSRTEFDLSSICLSKLNGDIPITSETDDVQDFEEFKDLVYDNLEYLAEYICKRYDGISATTLATERKECSSTSSFISLDHVSEVKPFVGFMNNIQQLDRIFGAFNDDGLSCSNNFLKILLNKAEHVTCSEEIKLIFFRAKLYFRIKYLNANLVNNVALTKKRKLLKTIP